MPKDKQEPFFNAEQGIQAIEALLETNKDEDVIAVADLRAIVDRVAIGGRLTLRGIKAGIMECLNRANAGGGQKLASAQIFAYMRRGGDKVPLPTIDTALIELEQAGAVHCDRTGALTVWGIGKAPAIVEKLTGEGVTP